MNVNLFTILMQLYCCTKLAKYTECLNEALCMTWRRHFKLYTTEKILLICLDKIRKSTNVSMAYALKLQVNAFFLHRADLDHFYIVPPAKKIVTAIY